MTERITEQQLRKFLKAAQSQGVAKRLKETQSRVLDELQEIDPEPPVYDVSLRRHMAEAALRGRLQGLAEGFRIALGEADIPSPYSLVKHLESDIKSPLLRRRRRD